MNKKYITPALRCVSLGGNICESLVVGSGKTDATSGDGIDLVKEDYSGRTRDSYNVWNDDWSK